MAHCRECLVDLMCSEAVVEVTNPNGSVSPWYGRILSLGDMPTMLLEQLDGFRVPLPQSFTVRQVDDWSLIDALRSRIARLERELAAAHDLLKKEEAR